MISEQQGDDDEEGLQIVPIPALVAILLNREDEKGSRLTQEEVLNIRDNCDCVAMPLHALNEIIEARGYVDIDPDNVWEAWSVVRSELVDNGDT